MKHSVALNFYKHMEFLVQTFVSTNCAYEISQKPLCAWKSGQTICAYNVLKFKTPLKCDSNRASYCVKKEFHDPWYFYQNDHRWFRPGGLMVLFFSNKMKVIKIVQRMS